MAQLLFASRCTGSYDDARECMKPYGQICAVSAMVNELTAAQQRSLRKCKITPKYMVLSLELALEEEAGVMVRELAVHHQRMEVLWTDSEAIKEAISDPPGVGLTWCINRFKKDNKGCWETFWDAHGACYPTTIAFHRLLLDKKVITPSDIERRHSGFYTGPFARAAQGWHAFNYVRGFAIDWTYRQIDRTCKIPHIYKLQPGQFGFRQS